MRIYGIFDKKMEIRGYGVYLPVFLDLTQKYAKYGKIWAILVIFERI